MKKWIVYSAVFLLVYVFFLIATLPANLLVSKLPIPKTVELQGVSGSVWTMHVQGVVYQEHRLENVTVSLNPLSLFVFDPELAVSFGDAVSTRPEGNLILSGLFSVLTVEDAVLNIAANDVTKELALPIPVEAHNYITVTLDSFVVGAPVCEVVEGKITWPKASISAFNEKVKLGKMAANIRCEQGAIAIEMNPNNVLGLSFTTYIRSNRNISGTGYLTPGEEFPQQVQPLLSFLGQADNKGRYRLNF